MGRRRRVLAGGGAAVAGLGLVVALVVADPGDLLRQEAEARARTCAVIHERRVPGQFAADPAGTFAVLLGQSGPDRYEELARAAAARGGLAPSNVQQLVVGCPRLPVGP